MKLPSPRVLTTLGLLLLAAVATLAQEATSNPVVQSAGTPAITGTSTPPADTHAADTQAADTPTADTTKPSPIITDADAHAPVLPPDGTVAALPPTAVTNPKAVAAKEVDPKAADYGIVTSVPFTPGELSEGTMLRVHIDQEISTSFTRTGTPFTARTIADVMQGSHVIIPVGTVMLGRVTRVSASRRIKGRAKLHLRADELVLPDGTRMILHAQVIDTGSMTHTKTDGEGTIISEDNAKKNFAIAGAATGAGAITGAVLGGGIGAGVGAVAGAGIGTAHYLMAYQSATLPKDTTLIFQLTEPMPIQPLHE
jgi:hypothetical protein